MTAQGSPLGITSRLSGKSPRIVRQLRRTALGAALLSVHLSYAATPTPAVQSVVRGATFEFVLAKMPSDPLTYEKPLPMELVPYAIRTDKYWSIGTAFAIAPNTYVSAAHVLLAAVGSQFGAPALRDSGGHVYALDRVLKFSAQEDFVVFTISGAPAAVPLPTSRQHNTDDVVFAVGDALGEGVVIRDGLLTSETPEEQDGRWKWLRFSAAASPGNSGGPLLDAAGQVIGVVRAKSPNENLNYALPIARVLDGSAQAADFDVRYSVKLPNARATEVATLKTQFALPKNFADFARTYQALILATSRRDQQHLRSSLASQLFPKGNSAKLLATVYDSALPSFVQQDNNDAWDVLQADNVMEQDLPGGGLVTTGNSLSVGVFRLRRPDQASDDMFYQNPAAFMDLLLKGLKLTRRIGDQAIRVLSLGHPQHEEVLQDRFGRRWQVSLWPLGYLDSYVMCYALPVPEGYVGMLQVVPSTQLDLINEYFKSLADEVYVNYSGTPAQWQRFLSRRELRPTVFDNVHIDIDPALDIHYQSPRLTVQIPHDLIDTSAASDLELHTTYMLDGDKLTWDVGGIYLYKDQNRRSYIAVERHVQPSEEAPEDLRRTFAQMSVRGAAFDGVAGHSDDFTNYWIHESLGALSLTSPSIAADASVLYDVYYETDASAYPRDMEDTERRLLQGARILER